MARKQVVEVQCDRCTRTEHRHEKAFPEKTHKEGEETYAFFGTGEGLTPVKFKDLCTPCQKTVKNHLEQIGKKIDGLSPDRKGSEVLEDLAREKNAKKGTPIIQNGNGVVTTADVED
jgi:hypothetical protein